jgi:hypothetical protein
LLYAPGNDNSRRIHKWEKDVTIYINAQDASKFAPEIKVYISKLEKYTNGIKINITKEKDRANFIIIIREFKNEELTKKRYKYDMSWNGFGAITKSLIEIDSNSLNFDEQMLIMKRFIFTCLGYLDCYEMRTKSTCFVCSKSNDVTSFDLKLLKTHYSIDIKNGMNEKEVIDALLDNEHYESFYNEKETLTSKSGYFKINYNTHKWRVTYDTLSADAYFSLKYSPIIISCNEIEGEVVKNNYKKFIKSAFKNRDVKITSFNIKNTAINNPNLLQADLEIETKSDAAFLKKVHVRVYLYSIQGKSYQITISGDDLAFENCALDILEFITGLTT